MMEFITGANVTMGPGGTLAVKLPLLWLEANNAKKGQAIYVGLSNEPRGLYYSTRKRQWAKSVKLRMNNTIPIATVPNELAILLNLKNGAEVKLHMQDKTLYVVTGQHEAAAL